MCLECAISEGPPLTKKLKILIFTMKALTIVIGAVEMGLLRYSTNYYLYSPNIVFAATVMMTNSAAIIMAATKDFCRELDFINLVMLNLMYTAMFIWTIIKILVDDRTFLYILICLEFVMIVALWIDILAHYTQRKEPTPRTGE